MRHQQSVAHESNMRRFLDDIDQVLGVHQRLAQADRAVIGEDGVQAANHIPFAANLIGD